MPSKQITRLGLTPDVVKKNRIAIEKELIDAGIEKHTLRMKDKYRNIRPTEYYVSSMDALEHHLNEQGKKLIK